MVQIINWVGSLVNGKRIGPSLKSSNTQPYNHKITCEICRLDVIDTMCKSSTNPLSPNKDNNLRPSNGNSPSISWIYNNLTSENINILGSGNIFQSEWNNNQHKMETILIRIKYNSNKLFILDQEIYFNYKRIFEYNNIKHIALNIIQTLHMVHTFKFITFKWYTRNHSLGSKKADLNSTKYFHLSTQPSIICNGQLRDYQIEGVSWLINLRNNGLHGILADEMGLGKTLQCITLLAYLKQYENISGIHLIIVPKSTIINWCPSFNVFALEAANKEERKQLIKDNFKPKPSMDVIICSYEICMIEKAILKKINYEYIIVDEAHRLKNNASKFSTILRTEFKSLNRLLITGTPLQNNLRELWSLLNLLTPSEFIYIHSNNNNEMEYNEMIGDTIKIQNIQKIINEKKKTYYSKQEELSILIVLPISESDTEIPPQYQLHFISFFEFPFVVIIIVSVLL